jgi:hypothetical protein
MAYMLPYMRYMEYIWKWNISYMRKYMLHIFIYVHIYANAYETYKKHTWKLHGAHMKNMCNICGTYKENMLNMYGAMHVAYMSHAWTICGKYMCHIWNIQWTYIFAYMQNVCFTYDTCICCIYVTSTIPCTHQCSIISNNKKHERDSIEMSKFSR